MSEEEEQLRERLGIPAPCEECQGELRTMAMTGLVVGIVLGATFTYMAVMLMVRRVSK